MSELIALFVIGIFTLGFCVESVHEKKPGVAWFWGIIAVFSFGFGTFYAGPSVLGRGVVPDENEGIARRLNKGVAYQVVSSLKDGADIVLLVKQTGTASIYALRVKEDDRPSEYFTLIDGKPVAIVAPAPPDAKKK